MVNVGLVPNTNAPDPVSSVIAEARFALEGVPRKVFTPVARANHAHCETLVVGAGKTIRLSAVGEAFGGINNNEVVIVVGQVQPKAFDDTVDAVPCKHCHDPAAPEPDPVVSFPGVLIFPLVSIVAVAEGV